MVVSLPNTSSRLLVAFPSCLTLDHPCPHDVSPPIPRNDFHTGRRHLLACTGESVWSVHEHSTSSRIVYYRS